LTVTTIDELCVGRDCEARPGIIIQRVSINLLEEAENSRKTRIQDSQSPFSDSDRNPLEHELAALLIA
jgi:hypothetical protein